MKKRILWITISLGIMSLIFYFSSQNGETSQQTSDFFLPLLQHIPNASFLIRKTAHFTIFGCLGLSYYQSLSTFPIKKRTCILLSIILVFCYAISDEIHQSFTNGRSCQLSDVFLDTFGGSTYIILCTLYQKRGGSNS